MKHQQQTHLNCSGCLYLECLWFSFDENKKKGKKTHCLGFAQSKTLQFLVEIFHRKVNEVYMRNFNENNNKLTSI